MTGGRRTFEAEVGQVRPWTFGKTVCEARGRIPRLLRVLSAALFAVSLPGAPSATTFAAETASTPDNGDPFSDFGDGGKRHTASGFVCPARIGLFKRDTAGEADPQTGTDFCAYSALGGVYGTIKLTLLDAPYDARASLAPGFVEEEGTGGKRFSEAVVVLAASHDTPPFAVYTRTYETAKLETDHYRVLFAGAQFKNWSVETTIEYTDPRDVAMENEFLHAVYAEAAKLH